MSLIRSNNTTRSNAGSGKRLWLTLGLPPVIFLVVIVLASVYFGAVAGAAGTAVTSTTISEQVTQATPILLLGVQLALLLLLWRTLRAEGVSLPDMGWRVARGQQLWWEVGLGAVIGVGTAVLYFTVLSPLMEMAQRTIGDYVPAGELFPALSGSILPFFLANVLLAPFVEENLYRGYGLWGLYGRFQPPLAIFISCTFFGLLHWTGGFWYVLLTGFVAGGIFAGLVAKRGNIIAAFAAHLALNLVEFLYIWLWLSA